MMCAMSTDLKLKCGTCGEVMNCSYKHNYYWCSTCDPELAVYDTITSRKKAKEKAAEVARLNREADKKMRTIDKRWRGRSPSSCRSHF